MKHSDRMAFVGRFTLPPKGSPAWAAFEAWMRETADDPKVQSWVKKAHTDAVELLNVQRNNGAGLVPDQSLREFYAEYNKRNLEHGLRTMPSSFNVLEAFHAYVPPLSVFSLLPERDHLIRFSEFLEFITSGDFESSEHEALNAMSEGVIYSFQNLEQVGQTLFRIEGSTEYTVAGFSMVRHGSEVSVLMIAGEKTDTSTRTSELDKLEVTHTTPGKEAIRPDPSLKREAVALLGDPEYWRTLAAVRIDFESKTELVRYILKDCGNSYLNLTNDPAVVIDAGAGPSGPGAEEALRQMTEKLRGYETLFELCRSATFLPYYVQEFEDALRVELHTTAYGRKPRPERRREADSWPREQRIARREVFLLELPALARRPTTSFYRAPSFKIESSGYWKALNPDQVGEDRQGNPIHGKTWVTRRLTWVESQSDQVVAARHPGQSVNKTDDAETIYIMRSAMHPKNVWKVGRTTRSGDERADELSRGTGVPDKLFVIHEWSVQDSRTVERLIHERLLAHRLSESREFFEIPLQDLVAVIDAVILETRSSGGT